MENPHPVLRLNGKPRLAFLMHASFTGWLLALFQATSVPQSLAWQAVFALILWALVAVLKPGPTSPQREVWTW